MRSEGKERNEGARGVVGFRVYWTKNLNSMLGRINSIPLIGSDICLVRAIQESGNILAWIRGLRNNNQVKHEAIRKDSVNHPPQTLQKPRTICFLGDTFYQRPKIRLQRRKGFDLTNQNMFRIHKEFRGKKSKTYTNQFKGYDQMSIEVTCTAKKEGIKIERRRNTYQQWRSMFAADGQLVWISICFLTLKIVVLKSLF